jgi:hypothetical protein
MKKSLLPKSSYVAAISAWMMVLPFVCFGDTPSAGDANPPATEPSLSPDAGSEDLRSLIGVNPTGLRHVDVPQVPSMALRGYIQQGNRAMALLELTDLKRIFLVQEGTEIPVTVSGTVTPTGHGELTGLDDLSKPNDNQNNNAPAQQTQSQIILKVLRISDEGVTVTAGMERQTIIIR